MRAKGVETGCRVWSCSLPFGGELLLQRGVGEPLVAHRNPIPLLRDVTPLFEKATRTVAGIDNKACGTARTRKLLQRIDQHGAHALPGGRRMNIYQGHLLLVLTRFEDY